MLVSHPPVINPPFVKDKSQQKITPHPRQARNPFSRHVEEQGEAPLGFSLAGETYNYLDDFSKVEVEEGQETANISEAEKHGDRPREGDVGRG